MHAPSEISNLQVAFGIQQQVFRLNVPVNNMLCVQIAQGVGHLSNVLPSPRVSFVTGARTSKDQEHQGANLLDYFAYRQIDPLFASA